MLGLFVLAQNEENQWVPVPAPKEIPGRPCKPHDSDKHVKETCLGSGANELLNFFRLCVCLFFPIKNVPSLKLIKNILL